MRNSSIVMVLVYSLFFFSCGKNGFQPASTVSHTTNASLFGCVTNEDGIPLKGVFVQTGALSTVTDSNGIFRFTDIVTPEFTLIGFKHKNFFEGFKTVSIMTGEDHFFRTMLIEMKNPTTFNGATGAVVQTDGNGSLTFPANSLVNRNTGVPYNGEVTVYTKMIDPTGEHAGDLMPGSNLGYDNDGNLKLVQPFNILGVELYDNAMQRLQVAPGARVQLSLPVPPALATSALADMPLSHLDESSGMWMQDGIAHLQGGDYVGEVSHFSYLGCNNRADLIILHANFVDQAGLPLVNCNIRFENSVASGQHFGYTNSSGKLRTYLPKNSTTNMEMYDPKCNIVIFSKDILTTTQDILMIEKVTIPDSYGVSVSGTITDCNHVPLNNGHIEMYISDDFKLIKGDALGRVKGSFFICKNPVPATLIVQDNTRKLYGLYNQTLVPGTNYFGTLPACGNSNKQYISWTSTVNGISSNFYVDVIETFYSGDADSGTNISGYLGTVPPVFINLRFSGPPTVQGSHFLYRYSDHLEWDSLNNKVHKVPVFIPVTITRYDDVKGTIEGSFNGQISFGTMIPNRLIKGDFSVRRHK